MGAKTHVTNDKISASKLIVEIFQTLEGLLNPKRLIPKASTSIVRLRNFSNTWDKPPLLPVIKISKALFIGNILNVDSITVDPISVDPISVDPISVDQGRPGPRKSIPTGLCSSRSRPNFEKLISLLSCTPYFVHNVSYIISEIEKRTK